MPLFRREPVKAEKPTEQPVQSPTPAPEKHETEIPESVLLNPELLRDLRRRLLED